MSELRTCAQCWLPKRWPEDFIGPRGVPRAKNCAECGRKYANWSKMSIDEKLATVPARHDPASTGRVLFVARSNNRKLGPIPLSMSERGTCPPSCAMYRAGCYASTGLLGSHWRGSNPKTRDRWLSWESFLEHVRALPDGQLWRHNEAGDLQGDGVSIDHVRLRELVAANRGRRGFTYSHYPYDRGATVDVVLHNESAFIYANRHGFTINASCDSLEQADTVRALSKFGDDGVPVVVTLAHDAPDKLRTARGFHVIVCPAQTTPGVTCESCQLCAKADRKAIIGFRAHGRAKAIVTELVRGKRKHAPESTQAAE